MNRREWLSTAVGGMLLSCSRFAKAEKIGGELAWLTLKQASDQIRAKQVSPVELTEACLARIDTCNPKITTWITVMRDQALKQAKMLEQEQAAGKLRSPLHGVPIGLKDTIDTKGVRTTAASAVYEYRFPTEDAEVVRKLQDAGAIVIGKCNMHEFDAGATSAVSYWGPVRNPWALERISGGPSGGPAAAVATAQCFAALGTDASGGIRVPASYCGVVGFKPTYGRVSIRGIVPFAWSLDHCGPMARTVEDAAMLLQQIAGYDVRDIDSVDHPVQDYRKAIGAPVKQFRIGIAPQFLDHLDPEISHVFDAALSVLKGLTSGCSEVSLPSLLHADVGAEVAAYHENLRGVNGGGYEPSTSRVFPSTADAAKAVDYVRGWRDLQMLRRTVDADVFEKQKVDFVVAPTVRRLPPTIEESLVQAPPTRERSGAAGNGGPAAAGAAVAGTAGGSGVAGGAASPNNPTRSQPDLEQNARPFNGYGLPVMSIPCGFSKDGLPIGIEICGPSFGEPQVLALAYAYQQATDWHLRKPPLDANTRVPALSKAAMEQTGG